MIRHALITVASLAVAACTRKASPEDVVDAGAATKSSVPVNAESVTRYPYEKKLGSVSASLVRDAVAVHKSPPDGPVIATLPKGANVIEIAQTAASLLVTFDDPTSGNRMMGWIGEEALTAQTAPTPNAVYVARKDSGAPTADLAKDAGAGGGGGSVPPAPGAIFVMPSGGKCPSGFTLANGGCRRTCATVKDCPTGTKCESMGSAKICTTG